MDGTTRPIAIEKAARKDAGDGAAALIKWRSTTIVAVGVSGVLLSLFLYSTLRHKEQRLFHVAFAHRSADRMMSIKHEFESGIALVRSVAAYVETSPGVTRDRFRKFTKHLLSSESTIHALGWNTRVPRHQLQSHVLAAKQDYPGYKVTEMEPDGTVAEIDLDRKISESRDFFLVDMIEPFSPNQSALGFDIASEPMRREALNRACRTGELAATAGISLVQEMGTQTGMLVMAPIYKKGADVDSAEQRRINLESLVVGVYRIGDTVEAAMRQLEPVGIDIYLFDESDPADHQLLYFHPSRIRGQPTEPMKGREAIEKQTFHEPLTFEVAGRRWTLYCTPAADYMAGQKTWLPSTVLGGGIFGTMLLVGYLSNLSRLTRQLRHQIDERLRAERNLRITQHSIDCSKIPVFWVTHDGRFRYVNAAAAESLGYRRDELWGMRLADIAPSRPDGVWQKWWGQLKVQGTATFESVHRRKDGSTFPVEVAVSYSCYSECEFMFAIAMDITERKRVQRQLTQTRFAVESAGEAIFTIDSEGRFVDVNRTACDRLGYSREELLTMSVADINPHFPADSWLAHWQELKRKGCVTFESEHRAKDGRIFPVEMSKFHFEFEQNEYACAFVRDITDLKRQENQLREHQQALAHISRLNTMGEMVAGIAHEVNQPLAAISNFAAACSRSLESDEHPSAAKLKEWTRQISEQAVRCGDIIRRLRGFVKKTETDHAALDLNQVVSESVALLDPEIRGSVAYDLVQPSPFISADRVEMQQVLVNLLCNAHEAMEECDPADRRILLRSQVCESCVQIAVEDHGRGIDEASSRKIFDAFFTTKPSGMGMGLAISKSIIENCRGRLWAEPRHPRGSTFHIQLPISR